MINFHALRRAIPVLLLLIGLIPLGAQNIANPCDTIEYDGEVQVTPNMTQDEISTLIFENGIQRNYSLGDYELARTLVELALGATNDEWAGGYFYRACIHLQTGNQSSATADFETFLELTDDVELATQVSDFIGTDMTVPDNTDTDTGDTDEETVDISFEDNPASFPDNLENDSSNRQALLTELSEASGLDFGGQVIVNEARTALATQGGNDFIEFAPLSETENFIMVGRINFTPIENEDDLHACGLLARTEREVRTGYFNSVSINAFLFLGFDSEGTGILLQNSGGYGSANGVESDESYTYDDGHEVVLIVLNDMATAYIDGERIIENFEMTPMFGGGFALTSFTGGHTGIGCGVENLVVYELIPDFPTGSCVAVAQGNINKRSGPGTNYAQAGLLSGDAPLSVTGQSDDSSGYVWWQLEDNTWVREDVAPLVGSCDDIPVVD